jgi:hypothetical protein
VAQKVQVVLVDDLDGGEAVETVAFSLDGTAYEIDLSAANAAKLRDDFASYVGAARKAGRRATGRQTTRRTGSTSSSRERAAEIRAWARDQGIKVSERGRIPADLAARYDAEH